jgi:hypothetical protein
MAGLAAITKARTTGLVGEVYVYSHQSLLCRYEKTICRDPSGVATIPIKLEVSGAHIRLKSGFRPVSSPRAIVLSFIVGRRGYL